MTQKTNNTEGLCISNGNTTIGTSTNIFIVGFNKKTIKADFIENEEGNFVEVTSSIDSGIQGHLTTSTYYNPVKSIVKERYGIVDGKIQLIKTISGKENPGYYVESAIEWIE